MEPVLAEALAPVLHDLAATGLTLPRFADDEGWSSLPELATAMLWASDGSGTGVRVLRSAPWPARVVEVADQVQEWAIENVLWGGAETSWPPCPRHPRTHPLAAAVVAGRAAWTCPADDGVVAEIGGLAPDPYPDRKNPLPDGRPTS